MNTSTTSTIENFIAYCDIQKRLDKKTLKAYRIDLTQFSVFFENLVIINLSVSDMESYIGYLNQHFKPKTVKRKLASLKAFFHYLEYKDIIKTNVFSKLRIKFREPLSLPKTIPLQTVEVFLGVLHKELSSANTSYKKKRSLLNIVIVETLFSTGIRISELCNLKNTDVNLNDGSLRIYGKGSKERIIQIGNTDVILLLKQYKELFKTQIDVCGYFFANPNCSPASDQSIRRMINKYCSIAAIDQHITPHMFRHTFATCLLEADVDIRYIQEMLGHSSITVTEIYTHVSLSKQKDILTAKHPRNAFKF